MNLCSSFMKMSCSCYPLDTTTSSPTVNESSPTQFQSTRSTDTTKHFVENRKSFSGSSSALHTQEPSSALSNDSVFQPTANTSLHTTLKGNVTANWTTYAVVTEQYVTTAATAGTSSQRFSAAPSLVQMTTDSYVIVYAAYSAYVSIHTRIVFIMRYCSCVSISVTVVKFINKNNRQNGEGVGRYRVFSPYSVSPIAISSENTTPTTHYVPLTILV